jgi:hypothetical protein
MRGTNIIVVLVSDVDGTMELNGVRKFPKKLNKNGQE